MSRAATRLGLGGAVLLVLLHAGTAAAQPVAATGGCIRPTPAAACIAYEDPVNAGCGTRGGPGCRKADGHCASWRDGYAPDCRRQRPAGAADGVAPASRAGTRALPPALDADD